MRDLKAQGAEGHFSPAAPKRALMVAYAYSPTMGSEYRHAWELSREIARHYELTVLFGDSDGLMGSFANYDAYCAQNVDPVTAIKVESGPLAQSCARLMLRMPFALFFAVLLRFWHRKAFAKAQSLHAERPFDLVHQLGPIGFRNPGYCWKLGIASYWGPIGGAQYINLRMIRRKFSLYFLEALLRNVDVWVKRLSPYIAAAAHRFDSLSFATPENRLYFREHFGRDGPVISDQGLYETPDQGTSTAAAAGRLKVAWGGTLTARKNVDLLLSIIKEAPDTIEFRIMGDGPMRSALDAASMTHPNLKVFGKIDRSKVQGILQDSDVILLTSLSEANTAILFEGMENTCVPIAPRINGFAACLNGEFAILYPMDTWDEAVAGAVGGLLALQQPTALASMKQNLRSAIPSLTWGALARKHMENYG